MWPARRCGAKHISKSQCTKHTRFGAIWEVEMSKKCTPLWREAHSQVKMYKTPQLRSTFRSCDVAKVHAVVARSTFRSQKWKKRGVRSTFGPSDVVLRSRHKGFCTLLKVSTTSRFRSSFNYNHYTTLHYTTTTATNTKTNATTTTTTLRYTTLHYTTLPL